MGLALIAAEVRTQGHQVQATDALGMKVKPTQFIKSICDNPVDLLGLSVFTATVGDAIQTAKEIKKNIPECIVVLGGPHPSVMRGKMLARYSMIDFIAAGEGEIVLPQLLHILENKGDLNTVQGLSFRACSRNHSRNFYEQQGGEFIVIDNETAPLIENLDCLPLPAYDLFDHERQRPSPLKFRHLPAYAILASRGCSHNCSFCSRSIHGKRLRLRSVSHIMQEIELLTNQYGAQEILFQDSSLCQNRDWLIELCEQLKKQQIEWSCLARIDELDSELIFKMKSSGCWQIGLGIESGNQRVLDQMAKGYTLKHIKNTVRMIMDAGIEVRGSYIIANPDESLSEMKKTIKFSREVESDFVSYGIAVPYPGTELYRKYKILGKAKRMWRDYSIFNWDKPFFIPDGVSSKMIRNMVRIAWIRYYFRPGFILNCLHKMKKFRGLKRYIVGVRSLVELILSV